MDGPRRRDALLSLLLLGHCVVESQVLGDDSAGHCRPTGERLLGQRNAGRRGRARRRLQFSAYRQGGTTPDHRV
jgi:hypothetical protein